MPQILDREYDAAWKVSIRDRIMKILDDKLQNTAEAYQRKIADNASAPLELLYRFQHEYNRDVLNLQTTADEEVKVEIARQEIERQWVGEKSWKPASDPTQALVEERLAMLTLKTKSDTYQGDYGHDFAETSSASSHTSPDPHHAYARESYSYASTEATSLSAHSSPDPYRERSMSNAEYNEYQALQSKGLAERDARLRAERQQKQQDDFRKRAEAILQRKRARRPGGTDAPESISATSSLNSSISSSVATSPIDDQPAPSEVVFKAENPMSEQDVTNLMTYHDQQWTFMLTQTNVHWVDFPWPLLSFSSPRRVEDLTLEAVAEYIFAPLNIHNDRRLVKDRLKDLIRRWHPSRFEIKYLARIADRDERDMVKDGALTVARILNDLLAKWNEL